MEDRTEGAAEPASGPGPDARQAEEAELPVRVASDVVRLVRPADDPEILEMILARLLNLH
jgi:hypothetical protein